MLLVQNRRRDGRVDWSPPGGVIDPGETLRGGLTREVAEETGLVVAEWQGPAYEIRAHAPDMGWELRVEAHVATHAAGAVTIDDPDGIVVDARFVAVDECATLLGDAPPWVAEPLLAWLTDRPGEPPSYSYRVEGTLGGRDLRVVRL